MIDHRATLCAIWFLLAAACVSANGGHRLDLADIIQGPKGDGKKIISLGQSAKLLYELTSEALPLKTRCELYLGLIKQRNTRTELGVHGLIQSAMKQTVPNLESLKLNDKLRAELAFNALDKVRILQASFDDEFAEFVEEDMVDVKNDLFDCVAHVADRHQKAMTNVGEYVADSLEFIKPLVYDSRHALDRIEEAQQEVGKIERSKFDKTDKRGPWLDVYKKLFVMIINNRYRLTQDIMGFLTQPETLDILDYMVDINDKMEAHKNSLVDRESKLLDRNKSLQNNKPYRTELLSMFIKASQNLDWLAKRTVSFTHQRTRWRIIRNAVLPFKGLSVSDVTWSPARVIKRDTFEALVQSCPFQADYFEHSLKNLQFDGDSLEPETAKWLTERLYPFALGCRSSEADAKRPPHIRLWYMFSISQKIQRWCLDRLNNPSLTDEDKLYVLSIMRLIP